MSVQRVERALRQHGLEADRRASASRSTRSRWKCVEVVPDSGRPAGEVIDEVRRGYLLERPRVPLRPGARGASR